MADEPDNLVLQLLRRIDAKVDRLAEEVHDLKIPMTSMEENMAVMSRRIDRIEARLDRIEHRLDLVDQPH